MRGEFKSIDFNDIPITDFALTTADDTNIRNLDPASTLMSASELDRSKMTSIM